MAKCVSKPRWSQALAAYRCQPWRRCPGWSGSPGDTVALSSEVVTCLCCRRDGSGATGMKCGKRVLEVGGHLRGASADCEQYVVL